MCMNQQRIKRRDMRVDGLVIELHAASIQYKNLNMPNHSLSCKCIQHQKINCQQHGYGTHTNLENRHQSQECTH